MSTMCTTKTMNKIKKKIDWNFRNFNIPSKVLFGVYGNFKFNPKLACFDLDGTLIKPKSGSTFPKSSNDWKFLHKNIKVNFSELLAEGYSIIIISNQNYENRPKILNDWKIKLQQIGDQLEDIPFICVAATSKDQYRKPDTGIWTLLEKFWEFGDADKPLIQESFFVGDAAGRSQDHSNADIEFATKLKLEFYTPEQYF